VVDEALAALDRTPLRDRIARALDAEPDAEARGRTAP
jgi:hypothetical protein